jgi:hypothetical protein
MLFVIVFFYSLIKLSNRDLKYRFLSLLKLNQFILRKKFVKCTGWYLSLTLFEDRAFAPTSCFPENFGVPKSHFSNQTFLQVIPKLRFPAMSATIIIALQARVGLETLRGAAISSILCLFVFVSVYVSSSICFRFNKFRFYKYHYVARVEGILLEIRNCRNFYKIYIIKFYEEIFKNFAVDILSVYILKEMRYNFSATSAYLVYRLFTKFNLTDRKS